MTDEMISTEQLPLSHPEEIKATWDLRLGKTITLQGSARCTPAGVVTAGMAVSAILLATTALVRAARRR
jgi:hypothetical protein